MTLHHFLMSILSGCLKRRLKLVQRLMNNPCHLVEKENGFRLKTSDLYQDLYQTSVLMRMDTYITLKASFSRNIYIWVDIFFFLIWFFKNRFHCPWLLSNVFVLRCTHSVCASHTDTQTCTHTQVQRHPPTHIHARPSTYSHTHTHEYTCIHAYAP